jgi:adenine phosphoribosyltransferase
MTRGASAGAVHVAEVVASHLRNVPDFPEPGVNFKDFSPLLASGPATATVVRDIASRYDGHVDVVAGIEARGFILGAVVAYELGVGFVPVRKVGKLPGPTLSAEYILEYGNAVLEVRTDAFTPRARALLLDDVLATGGTAEAASELIERAGAVVTAFEAVIELTALGGRSRLGGRQVHTILAL